MHFIRSIQKFPSPIEKVWDFYANPANLQAITPDNMDFRILSNGEGKTLFAGQIFEYKVSPMLGIPLYWKTEITKVKAPLCFIDWQCKGPYAHWQHAHHFKEIEGGVQMTDEVEYKLPWGWLGELAHTALVKRRLRQIFEYRFYKVEKIFGAWPGQPVPEIRIQ